MIGCGVGDDKRFLAGAEATLVDFVLIRSAPIMGGGQFDFWSFCRCHRLEDLKVARWVNIYLV